MRIERRHSICHVYSDIYKSTNHYYADNVKQEALGNILSSRDYTLTNIFDSRADCFKLDTVQAPAESRDLR